MRPAAGEARDERVAARCDEAHQRRHWQDKVEIGTKDERDEDDAPQCAETCKEVLRRFEEQWEQAGHGKAEVIMPLGFCDLGH